MPKLMLVILVAFGLATIAWLLSELTSCAQSTPPERFEILSRDSAGDALVYDREAKKFLVLGPTGQVTAEPTPTGK